MKNNDIGIDLGSENIWIYLQKENKIINSKPILAIDVSTNEIVSYGKEADLIDERQPKNIIIKRPIKKGKIEDIQLCVELLKLILKDNNYKNKLINPNVLLSYDNSLTNVDRDALISVIRELSPKNIFLMESLKLIALGIGMNIENNKGKMIIDIGYETTRIGVLSLNSIVEYKLVEIGSNSFNLDIIDFLKNRYEILVGNKVSETIKSNLSKEEIIVSGKHLITSLPNNITISSKEIKEILKRNINILIKEIKRVLESITPEILNDIKETGIVITGGGSMLYGFREKLEEELNIPVLEVNNPLTCVIDGIKSVINDDIKKGTKI